MNESKRPIQSTFSRPVTSQASLLSNPLVALKTAPLNSTGIRSDLRDIFHTLKTNLAQQREGISSFLETRMQALLYAERVTTQAMQEYPRQVDDAPYITKLWDSLHRIRRTASTWRTGEHSSDGQTELAIIENIIQNILLEDKQVESSEALA
jgi:hypothetical protein